MLCQGNSASATTSGPPSGNAAGPVTTGVVPGPNPESVNPNKSVSIQLADMETKDRSGDAKGRSSSRSNEAGRSNSRSRSKKGTLGKKFLRAKSRHSTLGIY